MVGELTDGHSPSNSMDMPSKRIKRKLHRIFSSVVEPINTHVKNFVACPGAQVYWWLRRRGCLTEDVNRMVRHCFTLDQQQKITRSKYITDKGYAVLDESNSDDIINAAAEEGIFNTTLGLSEKERRPLLQVRDTTHQR